jgi:hypothetical protein
MMEFIEQILYSNLSIILLESPHGKPQIMLLRLYIAHRKDNPQEYGFRRKI